jgi:hypothetical protein
MTTRILIGLIVLCGVALGVARDSKAAPLESWDDQIDNATRFKVSRGTRTSATRGSATP